MRCHSYEKGFTDTQYLYVIKHTAQFTVFNEVEWFAKAEGFLFLLCETFPFIAILPRDLGMNKV